MGAANFTVIAKGKTPTEAFNAAVERAQTMSGIGGYSGTIAEKHNVTMFDLKASGFKGLRARRLRLPSVVSDYAFQMQESGYPESKADALKKIAKLEKQWAGVPLRRMATIYDDKWGPAVGISLAKGEFLFFGMASE